MADKIGRNDYCPCGSGKKYKQCCLAPTSVHSDVADFGWRKLCQLEGTVVDRHLIPYVTQELPADVVSLALADCLPEDLSDTLDEKLLFNNFFIPWFLFNWIPFDDFGMSRFEPEITVAQNYIKYHEEKLSSIEKRFMEAMNQTYYSFYSILQVEVEKSLVVKDIMLGTLHTIKERQGTYQLKRGDVIFSRILMVDQQAIFIGMAPFIIPAGYHHDLIDFRQWLMEENANQALSPQTLRDEFDVELLDYFFEILKAACNKPLPTLANTDGELLQFSKSYFELMLTPEAVLNRLLPLTLTDNADEFLDNARCDPSGEIKRLEFPWLKKGNKQHRSWDNTVMGHFYIEKGRLILETNSEQRIQQGKKLLKKYLGDKIRFQQTLIETPEQKLKSLPKSHPDNQTEPDRPELPEVQEQIKAMAKAHWDSWFNEPIPALDNKTPREAAQTNKGREQLDALLLHYERYDLEQNNNNLFKADIHYLRTELALD